MICLLWSNLSGIGRWYWFLGLQYVYFCNMCFDFVFICSLLEQPCAHRGPHGLGQMFFFLAHLCGPSFVSFLGVIYPLTRAAMAGGGGNNTYEGPGRAGGPHTSNRKWAEHTPSILVSSPLLTLFLLCALGLCLSYRDKTVRRGRHS